jgi:phage-related protein
VYNIISYPDNGRPLIRDLIEKMKKSGYSKYYIDLRKYTKNLAEFGLEMNRKFKSESFKKIEDDMYELRPPEFRIIFTKKDDRFYLLNGFFKKSNETPRSEIDTARKHIRDIHDNPS